MKACDICLNALRAAATVDEETARRNARSMELVPLEDGFEHSDPVGAAKEDLEAAQEWPPDWRLILELLVGQIESGDWIDYVGHNVKMNSHYVTAVTMLALARAAEGDNRDSE